MLSPEGNGFIAVFVAAIVLGIRRPDLREHFERRADELVEIVKLGIFFVFGSLLTLHALTREGWPSLAFVAVVFLLARPLAVWVALLGTPTDRATRLFMGWFGPKGVATMTFALLVLDQNIASGPRIFDLTALVVFCSIIVHGLSDTPGANWIADHANAAGSGGVERRLLLRGGKCPGRARAALLAEHQPQLLGRAQFGLARAEGRAGLVEVERTEQVHVEEAVLASHLPRGALRRSSALRARHSLSFASLGSWLSTGRAGSDRPAEPSKHRARPCSRGSQRTFPQIADKTISTRLDPALVTIP